MILDLGCGRGVHAAALARAGATVVGVDSDEASLEAARIRAPRVTFLCMDAGALAFEDDTFEEVHALDVLEHVGDLDRVAREIARVLKPGGRFLARVPAAVSERWLVRLRPTYLEEMHHVRVFREGELEETMAGVGLKLTRRRPRDFLQHVTLWYRCRWSAPSAGQLDLGDWRASRFSTVVHVAMLLFERRVTETRLRYVPLWLVTRPIGAAIELVGDRLFPKAIEHEFVKPRAP